MRCRIEVRRCGRGRSAAGMVAVVFEFPLDMKIGTDRIHEAEVLLSTPVALIMTLTLDDLRLLEG